MDSPDRNDQENFLNMSTGSISDSHVYSSIEDHNNISNNESPPVGIGCPNGNGDGVSNKKIPIKRFKIKLGELILSSRSAGSSSQLPPPPAKRIKITFGGKLLTSSGLLSSQLPARGHQRSMMFNNEINATTETKRKCLHCQTLKSPQWREGPMGRHTLCNACGLRFKQGRLLPEYCPANSPAFSAQSQSNLHKKVQQIRQRKRRQDHNG